jgi:pSer/pThr/pTyr-binding forkhead associated (FHA) protein
MKAKLFCKTGQLAGASFEIGTDAMIGKSAECAIQLYPQLISSRHARIYFDERERSYFLEDLNSRNGTKLDGTRVKTKERLGSLHVITLANTFDFLFQVIDEKQQIAAPKVESAKPATLKTEFGSGYVPQQTPPPAMKQAGPKTVMSDEPLMNVPLAQDSKQKTMFESDPLALPSFRQEPPKEKEPRADAKISADVIPPPAPLPPKPPAKMNIFALVLDSTGKSYDLAEGSTFVGRDASCGIYLDDASVSRKHAEFSLKGGKLTLKDLGSKNHTFINDQKISAEVELREGMQLAFGSVKARVLFSKP